MPKNDLQEKVGSNFADQFQDRLDHENTRKKIITVFREQIDTVFFSDIVKKYASEEMDKRVFRSFKYWSVVVITALLTSSIGVLIGYISKKSINV